MLNLVGQRIRSFNMLLAFGIFVFGAVAQGIPLYLLACLFYRDKGKRMRLLRRSVRFTFKCFIHICSFLRVYKVKTDGFSDIHDVKGTIFIANHPSLVDYVILYAHLPVTTCVMVKASLTRTFMRFVIKGLGYVTNETDPLVLKAHIDNGENVLIFPEGTRTSLGEKMVFHRGFASLALDGPHEVLPFFISCDSPGFLAHGFWSFSAPSKIPVFTLKVGSIQNPGEILAQNLPRGIAARHLTKELEHIYEAMLEQGQEQK